MRIMKKSVSPLIATVLLIAFTVAIGSVVMNWGTSYIKEEQTKATSTSDVRLTCATDVSLKLMKINNLQDYCYTNDSENVTLSVRLTKGVENFKGVRINIISNGEGETLDYNQSVENLNFNLKLTGFSTDIINENNLIEYVELVPYIDNNGDDYFCSGSSLVINDLYPCGFTIIDPFIQNSSIDPPSQDPPLDNVTPEIPTDLGYNGPPFISLWSTSETSYDGGIVSESNQIKLPLLQSGYYNFTIDWGDGNIDSITSYNQPEVIHTYDEEGEYTLEISGDIIGFAFNNQGDDVKILEISQWGGLRLGNTGGYFHGAENLFILAEDTLNLTGTTNFSKMFAYNYNFDYDISGWDVSNVTDMSYMFLDTSFDQDISNWNVSNVIDMNSMFYYSYFTQDISGWDVSNVVNMSYMFFGTDFDQDISGWDVSNVEDMSFMFAETYAFDQDISSWNVSNVKYMNSMFYLSNFFNQDISGWDVSNVIDMNSMFAENYVFNQDISGWDVSSVTNMSSMFYYSVFDQDISSWDVSSVQDINFMFEGSSIFVNISDWDVSNLRYAKSFLSLGGNIAEASLMYDDILEHWSSLELQNNVILSFNSFVYYCNSKSARDILVNNYNWDIEDYGELYTCFVEDTSLLTNEFISKWNTSKTDYKSTNSNQIKLPLESNGIYSFTINWGDGSSDFITSYDQAEILHTYDLEGVYELRMNGTMFGFTFNLTGDSVKLIEISQWGDLIIGNTGYYFSGTSNLVINTTDVLKLENVRSIKGIFYHSGVGNISRIEDWDVSKIRDMSYAFSSNYNFNQDLSSWDFSSVKNMDSMFSYSNYNQNISSWDVSSVEDMSSMFYNNNKFNYSLNEWNVSKVKKMFSMFHLANAFNQPLNNWDVSNVEDMSFMFYLSSSFNQPLNNWDVSSVKTMKFMFGGSEVFNQPLNEWNVSKVENMRGMFSNSDAFNQDISNWCVISVTNADSFSDFSVLEENYKPIWGTCPN